MDEQELEFYQEIAEQEGYDFTPKAVKATENWWVKVYYTDATSRLFDFKADLTNASICAEEWAGCGDTVVKTDLIYDYGIVYLSYSNEEWFEQVNDGNTIKTNADIVAFKAKSRMLRKILADNGIEADEVDTVAEAIWDLFETEGEYDESGCY